MVRCRTFAIRFALAYLWSLAPSNRKPFDEFWLTLSNADMWRFSSADRALSEIYRQIGVERDHEIGMKMWGRCAAARKDERDM